MMAAIVLGELVKCSVQYDAMRDPIRIATDHGAKIGCLMQVRLERVVPQHDVP